MTSFLNNIVHLKSIDSTNDYLVRLYKKYDFKKELVVIANEQTSGRGRIGKTWFSDINSLTFSLSKIVDSKFNMWSINIITGLAVIHALSKYNIKALIKYPNDIIIRNKKIAGILTDVIHVRKQKYCVIGIGINVNNNVFPKQLSMVTSIKNILSNNIDVNNLLHMILLELDKIFNKDLDFLLYCHHLYGFKNYVPCIYNNCRIYVKILTINQDGSLLILTDKGAEHQLNDVDIKFLLD